MSQSAKKHLDPLIDEVRERRRQLWASYDNDIDKVYEAIKRLQAQHPEKVGAPRKPKKARAK